MTGGPAIMARQLLRGRLHADAADVLAAEERALALLDRVIADAYRQPVAEAAPHRPRTRIARRELVEAAKLVLTTRPGEAHSLASLARAVHASPFHLARVFRAETGQPIHRYLLQLRLALALERLADGAGSLVDLAFELGFTSHSHFTEAFRRRFGLPPSVCRRRLSRRLVGEMRKNPTA